MLAIITRSSIVCEGRFGLCFSPLIVLSRWVLDCLSLLRLSVVALNEEKLYLISSYLKNLVYPGSEGRTQGHRSHRRLQAASCSRLVDDDLSGGLRLDGRRRQHRSQVRDERHGGRRRRRRQRWLEPRLA